MSLKHKHCIFLLQIKVCCKPLRKPQARFKTHRHKMNPTVAVKSYILYTILKHLFIISKQRITFKIISLLVLLVLNYTVQQRVCFLAFRFIFMCWEAAKHGNTWISVYSLFKFLSQIYISSSLDLNSNLVLCCVHSD